MIDLATIHHVLFLSMFGWNYLFEILYDKFRRTLPFPHADNAGDLQASHRQRFIALSQNAKNAIHAGFLIVATIAFGSPAYPYLALSSSMFYIHDTYILLKYMTHYTTAQLVPYLCHHLISIASLCYCVIGYHTNLIIHIHYILDCSNIFLYATFHFMKVHQRTARRSILNLLILAVELAGYAYFRLYVFTSYLIANRFTIYTAHIVDITMLVVLYLMGVVWSSRLARRVIYDASIIYNHIPRLE